MKKVNIYCNGVSVRHKTTIAVLSDLVLDPAKLQQELGGRLVRKAEKEKLSINPSWLSRSCEIERDPGYSTRLFVAYPPSLPNIEEMILQALTEIEDEVKAAIKAEHLRGLLEAEGE